MDLWISNHQRVVVETLLKRIRADAGMTQKQLAAALGRPQSYVSKCESGERRLDVLELREVCNALGVTLARFCELLEEGLS